MKRNIVSILRDRELNSKVAPSFSTSKIVRRLINSDKELYTTKWSNKSKSPIFYENEMLFFDIYRNYISVNSIKRNYTESPAIRSVEDTRRKHDAIVYSGLKNIENIACQCELNCICFSQRLVLITESNCLDIHLLANGRILRRVYLGQDTIVFRECDWVEPNERFSLIGDKCPIEADMNAIHYLMVFTVPLELHVFLEIKEMVFPDVESVKLFQNLLIVENSTNDYLIYRFDEFIKQGTLTPYKLGDAYKSGKIGSYPTGIPINFTYDDASPILFKVRSLNDILMLNAKPTHFITRHRLVEEAQIYEVKASSHTDDPLAMASRSDFHADTINKISDVKFHPDKTAKVIVQTRQFVDSYKILSGKHNTTISRQHRFETSPIPFPSIHSRVLCFAYNSELNIFGLLVQLNDNINYTGIVNIYDNSSGEILRTVQLKDVKIGSLINYSLCINSYSLVVMLTGFTRSKRPIGYVHVFVM